MLLLIFFVLNLGEAESNTIPIQPISQQFINQSTIFRLRVFAKQQPAIAKIIGNKTPIKRLISLAFIMANFTRLSVGRQMEMLYNVY